jgi:hypothetical protein
MLVIDWPTSNDAWFGGRTSTWKVRSGTYCCFNAFSRVDVRVDVKIPGGVEAYVVDLRGEKPRGMSLAISPAWLRVWR